ncbi:hypothetical protein C8R45DRAFT_1008573 [Mycena sanguinolenta]|nr:hypothetical protein C8R45DRAFT_1008573 [Mycena sanguinolenta]
MPPRYSLLHPPTLHHILMLCVPRLYFFTLLTPRALASISARPATGVGTSVRRPEAMDLTGHRNEGQEPAAPRHGSDSVSVFVAPGRAHRCALRCRPTWTATLTAAAPPAQLKLSLQRLSHSASI